MLTIQSIHTIQTIRPVKQIDSIQYYSPRPFKKIFTNKTVEKSIMNSIKEETS